MTALCHILGRIEQVLRRLVSEDELLCGRFEVACCNRIDPHAHTLENDTSQKWLGGRPTAEITWEYENRNTLSKIACAAPTVERPAISHSPITEAANNLHPSIE